MTYIDEFEDRLAQVNRADPGAGAWLEGQARHYAATADRLRDAIHQVDDALQRGPLSRDRLEEIVLRALT